MIRTLLLGIVLLAAPAVQAQTPFSFTTNGRPAVTGDDVSLAQMLAQGATKQDVTVNLGTGFTGTVAQFLSGAAPIRGLRMTPAQSISYLPIGNEAPTLGSVVVQGSSVAALTRQFMVSLGMTSATGAACDDGQCGNVTLYTSMRQMPGSTDAWAQNILVKADRGTNRYLQGVELDVDNDRGDSGTEVANWIGGLTITGTNTDPSFLNRQAVLVSSGYNRALWHAGVLGDDSSVKDALVLDRNGGGTFSYWNRSAHAGATLFDQGTAPVSLALSGTYSRAAVATENATTPMALSASAGQKVCFASGHACAWFDATAGKWMFSDDNDVVVFSVARTSGNAVFKGTVTQNGTP